MDLTALLAQNLGSFSPAAIGIAFLGGILASFTPCIYPLIPVTIAFIGGLSGGSRIKGFIFSAVYVLGIAIVYSGLGMMAAMGGKMFGSIASSPWASIIIGNICLIFALSFFGIYEINFAIFKGNINSKSKILLAFGTGALAALTASSCTAPILGVLLSFVAQTQNVIYKTTLLFSFALGLDVLFLICGTFAGFMSSLPKAGKWMLAVKYFFGIVLIIMAEYYFIRAGKLW